MNVATMNEAAIFIVEAKIKSQVPENSLIYQYILYSQYIKRYINQIGFI